jgi:Endoplasmic reticulum protein ERp29, C-terminal domain
LASKFFAATGAARDAIYKEASALAAQVGPAATHYIRVMEKVANGTEDYFVKESKRYVHSPSFNSVLLLRTALLMSFSQPYVHSAKASFGV